MQKLKTLIKRLLPKQLLGSVLPTYHLLRAVTANLWYGFPARRLTVIGVTGTNGKTTTAIMLGEILARAEYPVGVMSSAVVRIKNDVRDSRFKLTTEDAFRLQKMLRQMVRSGVTHLVLEVSSHSLMQHRVWGVRFKGAIFTNLTQDHLDYHGTMEAYAAAKKRLFMRASQFIVLNRDDKYCQQMKVSGKKVITYGIEQRADVTANWVEAEAGGWQFQTTLQNGQKLKAGLLLSGQFNIYNALAASIAAAELGVASGHIKEALESIKAIPGRMEKIDAGQDFTLMVDHAHTPDALEHVLKTIRHQSRGRVITVTGADGERDAGKRAPIGEIIARLSDHVFICDQEPFADPPGPIRRQIIAGIRDSGRSNFTEVADRRAAIEAAVRMARRGDTILVAGLGNQQYRGMKSGNVRWDERAIAKEAIKMQLRRREKG